MKWGDKIGDFIALYDKRDMVIATIQIYPKLRFCMLGMAVKWYDAPEGITTEEQLQQWIVTTLELTL